MSRNPPTLLEVARAAGVSVTTASRVLNSSKHASRISAGSSEKVRNAAASLGYQLNYHARSMRLGRAETIGVVIHSFPPDPVSSDNHYLCVGYFSRSVAGIEMHCRAAGYRISLIADDGQMNASSRAMLDVQQRRLDGLIAFGPLIIPGDPIFRRDPEESPVVLISPPAGALAPGLSIDEEAAVDVAMDHLCGLGHRNIAYIGPAATVVDAKPVPREQAFITAAWARSVRGESIRYALHESPDPLADGTRVRLAAEAMRQRLDVGPPSFTSVFCYNDLTALGVVHVLAERGLRVPDDVSVIGFDDIQAKVSPIPLTSVDLRITDIGGAAADLLIELLADPEKRTTLRGHRRTLQPKLAVRASTAAAKP